MSKIDIVKHSAYIAQCSRKMKREFPSISLEDIIQELNLLVIEYDHLYDENYAVTTFIAKYPARKLRQTLIYKYVNFTYDADYKRVFVDTYSMDSKINVGDDSPNYSDSIELVEAYNNEYKQNDNEFNDSNIVDIINNSSLNKIEKQVIIKRFGLEDKIWTLQEIGEKFDLTRERIRQIEIKAKKILAKNTQIKELAFNLVGK